MFTIGDTFFLTNPYMKNVNTSGNKQGIIESNILCISIVPDILKYSGVAKVTLTYEAIKAPTTIIPNTVAALVNSLAFLVSLDIPSTPTLYDQCINQILNLSELH